MCMKKFIVAMLTMIMVVSIGSPFYAYADNTNSNPKEIRVVAVSTRLYNSPDISDVMIFEGSEVRVYHGEIFEVLSSVVNSYSFYEINYNEKSAYILKAYVIDNTINSNSVKLDTNGSVIENVNLYEKVGENFNELELMIEKDTRIKILEKMQDYTKISFEKDGEILTYYIPNTYLSADGMSSNGIIAISLIITCTSIILILFGFKKKKKSK